MQQYRNFLEQQKQQFYLQQQYHSDDDLDIFSDTGKDLTNKDHGYNYGIINNQQCDCHSEQDEEQNGDTGFDKDSLPEEGHEEEVPLEREEEQRGQELQDPDEGGRLFCIVGSTGSGRLATYAAMSSEG